MDAPLKIEVPGFGEVTGLWQAPVSPSACLALAHGAGAGMTHRAMAAIADGLQARGVATLRYQFPYMERGGKRPDGPAVAHATVRAAAAEAARLAGGCPLFAGGRSFGARMTSQAQPLEPLPGVQGLVFFAYPLHPAGKPAVRRADHLAAIALPMLFLQGSRDALAEQSLLHETIEGLRPLATLELIVDADHAFHVPARSGHKDLEVLGAALDIAVRWMETRTERSRRS